MQYLDRAMLPCPSSWIRSSVQERKWRSLTVLTAPLECTAVDTLRTLVWTALDVHRVRLYTTCTFCLSSKFFRAFVYAVGAPCSSPGSIQLVGGVDQFQGRVEVCTYASVNSTVCSEGWDNLDAQVVCRQLGFNGIPNTQILTSCGSDV